ncbi:Conserved oligomeric Golgi complex subunit 6 [Nymphon striatum]|nr:Conserved oligomeric Golgi complex subunit 6 [Nymphon striatum]
MWQEGLWHTMEKYNIGKEITTLIRELYNKAKSKVLVDEQYSDWFGASVGVRQGCLLSPILFNLFLERIMEDALADYSEGLRCAGRKVTDLRFADDIDLIGESEKGLQELTKRVEKASMKYGMEISTEKSKVMIVGRQVDSENKQIAVIVNGQKLDQVNSFTYLGSKVDESGKSEKEIRMRIGRTTSALAKLENTWRAKNIAMKNKILLMRAIVESTLLYACESWTVSKNMEQKLRAFEMKTYRRMLGISWKEKKTNKWVRNEVKRICGSELESVIDTMKRRKFKYFGHMVRGGGMARAILEGEVEGSRGRGRPMGSWLGNLKEWSGQAASVLTRRAEDRVLWMNSVRAWATKAQTHELISQTTALQNEGQRLEMKQEVASSFLRTFQLTYDEIRILRGSKDGEIDKSFFSVLERVKTIHNDCKVLLRTKQQTAGLEIMEMMAMHQEAAYERLYRWSQGKLFDSPPPLSVISICECRMQNLESTEVSQILCLAMKSLKDRPVLFKYTLDEFGTARRAAVVRAFIDALTRGGPGGIPRPIELHSHDPIRYVGDMLAWLHQSSASEKECIEGFLNHCEYKVMEKLSRSRIAARSWARRTAKAVKELLLVDDVDMDTLTEKLRELDLRIENLDIAQTEIELIIDAEDLESDIDNAEVESDIRFISARLPQLEIPNQDGKIRIMRLEVAKLLKKNFEKAEIVSTKVLGLSWLPTEDWFVFEGATVQDNVRVTKILILSLIARSFDPLGFLSPYIMSAKCLFQELWKMAISWDEEVPEKTRKVFQQWVNGMVELKNWKVPRSFTGKPWRDNGVVTVHAFGDASEKGYGGSVYIVVKCGNGSVQSSLVMAKARLAPLKRITLPRLELMGALLCARLLQVVLKALNLPKETPYCCWTDSSVTISWIKSDAGRWKTFVANRVTGIQEITNPSNWFLCSGKENPADLLTRGLQEEKLMNSKVWLKGPEFMWEDCWSDKAVKQKRTQEFSCENLEDIQPNVLLSKVNDPPVVPFHRFGSFLKPPRVVSWVNRFVFDCRNRNKPKCGKLKLEEIDESKYLILKFVQNLAFDSEGKALLKNSSLSRSSPIAKLSPFLDEVGLLRVGGQLTLANLPFEEKHPIILPKSHISPLMVKHYHHLLKHGGVNVMLVTLRKLYWIIGARRLAKSVKRQCFACNRVDAQAINPPMAPLPRDRIIQARPFQVMGVDYAGPVFCHDFPNKKYYILLITCAVTRAIHLELVSSLFLDMFSLAFRRFISRRGMPVTIYADNAKTFVAAEQHLVKMYGDFSPKWKYITPRAPWQGGWWERLVRSVKSALRKSIGCRFLSKIELETNLIEIEACINSRPLTFVSDESEPPCPLTPACFLIGRTSLFNTLKYLELPAINHQTIKANLAHQKQLLQEYWYHWHNSYIKNLPTWKGMGKAKTLKENTLVLIRTDNCPRLLWPIGLIVKLFPGKDGVARSAQLKTSKGLIIRPTQRLHLLEITETQQLGDTDISDEKEN